jgi:hypothetical protein
VGAGQRVLTYRARQDCSIKKKVTRLELGIAADTFAGPLENAGARATPMWSDVNRAAIDPRLLIAQAPQITNAGAHHCSWPTLASIRPIHGRKA